MRNASRMSIMKPEVDKAMQEMKEERDQKKIAAHSAKIRVCSPICIRRIGCQQKSYM